MAITLVHRYESGNTTDVPSSLVRGEIALNTQNGKLWFGNNSGATSSAWNLGPTLRIGRTLDTTQEDNMLIFDGHAQDFRMGIDDSSDLLEIGAGTTHATTPALTINSSGEVTTIGQDTHTSGQFLKYDGSKVVWDSVSTGSDFAVGDITGATALTSGLASTDELVLSDAGTLKRMDMSVLKAFTDQSGADLGVGSTDSPSFLGMTIGADAATDAAIIFGHDSVKSIIGVDESSSAFCINTDAAFESGNDFEIDTSGNVTLSHGSIIVANGEVKTPTIAFSDGDNAITIADGGACTFPQAAVFSSGLTGSLTGNASGTAATVTTAAQPNITSLGTLTTLTVDDITINGSTISDAADFTLDIGGDIILDADGGNLYLKNGGTTYWEFDHGGNDLKLTAGGSNFEIENAGVFLIDSAGNFEVDSEGDIILDAAGDEIYLKDAGTERFKFNLDSTPELDVTGAFTIDCSAGITLDANAGSSNVTIIGDLSVGSIINSGTDITLDSSADIVIDAAGGNIEFKDAGTAQLTIDMDSTAGDIDVNLMVDGDDLVFNQYDGTEIIRFKDNLRVTTASHLYVGGNLNTDEWNNTSGEMLLNPATDVVVGSGTWGYDFTITNGGDGAAFAFIAANSSTKYLNFCDVSSPVTSSSGYGFRDNSGTMQVKNNGGAWSNFGVAGGEANVDAYGHVAVDGQTTCDADQDGDTLTFVAGSNMTITTSGDDVTFAASAGGSGDIEGVTAGTGLSGGGSSGTVSLATTNSQSHVTSVGALDSGSITSGFGSIDNGTSGIRTATFTAETSVIPDASGGATLGSTTKEWGHLYIADDSKIYLGSGQDVSLEYDEDGTDQLRIAGSTIFENDITIGADSDGTDRSITWGHSTLKTIMGIDDSQDAFAINTDGSFETQNDFEIDASGNITMYNGYLQAAELRGDSLELYANSGTLTLSVAGGNIDFDDGGGEGAGTTQLRFDLDSTGGQVDIQLKVDSDDLVFKQYDGNEVMRVADDRKLYFYDQGGESIHSDGSYLYLQSGGTEFKLPASDGSNTNVLQTNGSGVLSWASAGSGDITAVVAGDGLDGGATSGSATLTVDVSDFAGDGLADDGSENLDLDIHNLGTTGTAVHGTADYFAYSDAGTTKKIIPANITLSSFSNDSGWTANAGTTTASNSQTFTNKVWNGTAIASGYIANDAIDSQHYADGSIDNAHIADNAIDSEHYADGSIDNAHIADNAIDSEHYADGSIDNAHIADDAIDSEHYAAGSIDTAHIADDQVTLAKMAGITRGSIIIGNSSGNPAALAIGSNDYVLTSDGTDIAWESAGGGGGGVAIASGDTNNYVMTSDGTGDSLIGEAGLTFSSFGLTVGAAANTGTYKVYDEATLRTGVTGSIQTPAQMAANPFTGEVAIITTVDTLVFGGIVYNIP